MLKKTRSLPLPLIGAVAATRGMLGAGAGLLLARHVSRRRRRRVGMTLLGIGLASTVPLAIAVFRRA